MHYFPLDQPFLFIFFFLLVFLIVLIQINVLGYVYGRMGIDRRYIYILLALSLLGSYINIPIVEIKAEQVVPAQVIHHFGMRYIIPPTQEVQRTVIAVNLGGAVIPILLSIYLMIRNQIFARSAIGIAIVAVIVYFLSQPIRGVGIAVPTLIPPIVTAAVALLLSRRQAAPLAYICGSLGTLIGADILNLWVIPKLGAPVASIGGAGTFDGIFLTGILAVLLASAFRPKRREPQG